MGGNVSKLYRRALARGWLDAAMAMPPDKSFFVIDLDIPISGGSVNYPSLKGGACSSGHVGLHSAG